MECLVPGLGMGRTTLPRKKRGVSKTLQEDMKLLQSLWMADLEEEIRIDQGRPVPDLELSSEGTLMDSIQKADEKGA